MFRDFFVSLYGETTYRVFAVLLYLYPIWLPLLLGFIFWKVWLRYVRYFFFSSTKVVLLEVRLPREIMKSPAAMEILINGFYQTGGESTFIARYWEGKTRAWFSLELVSIGGQVHFYIWTRENMRQIVEAHIYSQYPEVEVRQVEDYSKEMVYNPDKYEMWAANYELTLPDPLPLKTYIDYGLDKNPKPENEVNPIGTVLEVLNSIKPSEQIWLQFVIRAHKKEKRGLFSKKSDWTKEVDTLRTRFFQSVTAEGRRTLSTEENKVIDALHRSVQKAAFDTGIRVMYIADKGAYNNTSVTSLRGLFRHFSATFGDPLEKEGIDPVTNLPVKQRHYAAFNGLKAEGTDTDYPWDDFRNIRMNRQKKVKLDAYKRRMFFFAPHVDKTMILTSEELATLYHFPSSSVMTPGLQRIESKRAQAPTNLPV
ncbi:MAG: hypothetical protein M3Q73_04300 [bacterium]|nr:hypothetical protein [bacterium]